MKLKMPHLSLFMMSLLAVFLFSACEEIIDPPQQSISPREANILEEEFVTTRGKIINDSLDIVDRRDFWFSLDSLKQYIAYVEQEAKKRGKKNLGMRVYFAAYPKEGNYADPGFATVFMVPTAQAERTGEAKGFFPMPPPPNQNMDSINALNYGHGGQPPNDY